MADCENGVGSKDKALEFAKSLDQKVFSEIFFQIEKANNQIDYSVYPEISFFRNPHGNNKRIPKSLEFLQAEKIRIEENEASIMMWMCVDQAVELIVSGLRHGEKKISLYWDEETLNSEILWLEKNIDTDNR